MDTSGHNPLSPEELFVIEAKGTERPFTGEYDDFYEAGTYVCRRATPNSIGPPTSLTPVVAGRRSIKRYQEP